MYLMCVIIVGPIVECLETLVHGAESRRKVVRSRPAFAMHPTNGKLCQPSSTFFLLGMDKAEKGEG